MAKKNADIREMLKDICNIFHLLDDDSREELNLVEVQADSIVVEMPKHLPKDKNIRGYIQKISLELFYAVEGIISDPVPGQKPETLRIKVDPHSIKTFDRRIYPRYVLRKPVEVVVTSEDEMEALVGEVVNLSPAGLRVEVPEPIRMEVRYSFNFEIDLHGTTYSLRLIGKPVSETRLSYTFVYGIHLGEGEADRQVESEYENEHIDLMTLVNRLIKRG
jgi:hypothetical protein